MRTSAFRFFAFALMLLSLGACAAETEAEPTTANQDARSESTTESTTKEIDLSDQPDGLYALMSTTKGDILLNLEFERAPLTVMNFVGLAEGKLDTNVRAGQPFYDGLVFHRVVDNFVIQGGDPQGNGTGGPGYRFPNEIHPELKHDKAGILSMANAGPDTNGSQFFITHTATPHLDGNHPVFGTVVEGMDVVDAIEQGDGIESVSIVRKGSAAEAFVPSQEQFEQLQQDIVEANRQAEEEALADQFAAIAELYPNAAKSPEGVHYVIDREGNGPKPANGNAVQVDYELTLLGSDQVIDSSYARGQTLDFVIGQASLIPGFMVSLMDMNEGEQRTVIIPPQLGYGQRGQPPVIPGNAFLVFKLELVNVE